MTIITTTTTTARPTTCHLALMIELSRERRAVEASRWTALTNGNRGLVRVLEDKWQYLTNYMIEVTVKAARDGVSHDHLAFVAQHADDRQLMTLAADHETDDVLMAMIDNMRR